MKFIIARHTQTVANTEKKLYGVTQSSLTQKGLLQVEKLSRELGSQKVDFMYSSPLERAISLADAISTELGMKYEIRDELRELNFGMFENKTYGQIEEQHPKEWESWTGDYKRYTIPGGDNFMDWRNATTSFIDSIKENEGTALIVTHGGNALNIITHLLGMEIDDMWHFKIEPAARVYIEYANGYGILSGIVPLGE